MALEIPASTPYVGGGDHSFTLTDLHHAVDVRCRVRWVRTDRRDQGGPGSLRSIQVAGFTFEEILTEEPEGIWANLQESPAASGEDEPTAGGPEMLSPANGAIVWEPRVTVSLRVPTPNEVTAISINGIDAALDGQVASAEIPVRPGQNRLNVLIWSHDGSYRTHSLGSVMRRETS